jgi:hypothetical protein
MKQERQRFAERKAAEEALALGLTDYTVHARPDGPAPQGDTWSYTQGRWVSEIARTAPAPAPAPGKRCPHCKTVYEPKYTTFEEAKAAEPESIYVEQHMTGFCSDKCWDEALKPDDY